MHWTPCFCREALREVAHQPVKPSARFSHEMLLSILYPKMADLKSSQREEVFDRWLKHLVKLLYSKRGVEINLPTSLFCSLSYSHMRCWLVNPSIKICRTVSLVRTCCSCCILSRMLSRIWGREFSISVQRFCRVRVSCVHQGGEGSSRSVFLMLGSDNL